MTLPTCPPDYACTFTPIHPRIITHVHVAGPWYDQTLGIIALSIGGLAVIAGLVYLLAAVVDRHAQLVDRRDEAERRKLERAHDLAMSEQRTMQMDMAKGNPEIADIAKGLMK